MGKGTIAGQGHWALAGCQGLGWMLHLRYLLWSFVCLRTYLTPLQGTWLMAMRLRRRTETDPKAVCLQVRTPRLQARLTSSIWQPSETRSPCSMVQGFRILARWGLGKEENNPGRETLHSHSLSLSFYLPVPEMAHLFPFHCHLFIAPSQGSLFPLSGGTDYWSCSYPPVLIGSIKSSSDFLRVSRMNKRWKGWKMVQLSLQQLWPRSCKCREWVWC